MDDLARRLDFANHHADATPKDIQTLCDAVLRYGFHTAFVNPAYVALAKSFVATKAKVGCVISFPLGQDAPSVKSAAANRAVGDGADELDVVPNLGRYFSGDTHGFVAEMIEVVESARMFGKPVIVKFILDPGYFDKLPNKTDAMQEVARAIAQSGADFVKIGSGMGPRNPTVDDVRIIKEAVPDMKIKVAGGVSTKEQAMTFFAAGVDRIGTSRAPDIINAANQPASAPVSAAE
jgi:deoxyribose-phosphate aldolase